MRALANAFHVPMRPSPGQRLDHPIAVTCPGHTLRDTQQAMSQETVEIVRRLYAGWERGDFAVEVDAYDPEVELFIDYLDL